MILVLLVATLSVLIQTKAQEGECIDTPDPRMKSATYQNCTFIVSSGFCSSIGEEYCMLSCEKCNATLINGTTLSPISTDIPTPLPPQIAFCRIPPTFTHCLMYNVLSDDYELPIGFTVGGATGVGNFRRSIQEDVLPHPDDITFHGLANEYMFDTQNEQSTCENIFCPVYSAAISKDPLNQQSTDYDLYLTVGLDSNFTDFQRRSLNLVIVLDVSGSMTELFYTETDNDPEKIENQNITKLEVAKLAIIDIILQLHANDSVAIVLFDDFAEILLQFTPADKLQTDEFFDMLTLLPAEGETNLESGYIVATTVFRKCQSCLNTEIYNNRIIFFSDIQPNVWDKSEFALFNQVKQNAGSQIFTTLIGVGLDFRTEFTKAVSDTWGANYHIIESPDKFQKKMIEEFEFMVSPLLFDLKFEIHPVSFYKGKGWKVIKVYGSDKYDGGLEKEGIFVQINTLFPSNRTEKGIKGGVVLLKMQKPIQKIPLKLFVSYKERNTLQVQKYLTEVEILKDPPKIEFFQSKGAQKAVLLARYVDVVRGWLLDQYSVKEKIINSTMQINSVKQKITNSTMQAKSVKQKITNSTIQTSSVKQNIINITNKKQDFVNNTSISEQLHRQQSSNKNSTQAVTTEYEKSSIRISRTACDFYPDDRVINGTNEGRSCNVNNFLTANSSILPVFESIILENWHRWDDKFLPLRVSKEQGEVMTQFLVYMQDTIDEIGDETIEQEVGILTKLIQISDQT